MMLFIDFTFQSHRNRCVYHSLLTRRQPGAGRIDNDGLEIYCETLISFACAGLLIRTLLGSNTAPGSDCAGLNLFD
jgi:hypothetical protein